MAANKRKTPGRRETDNAVNIQVDSLIDKNSPEMVRVLAELRKGHRVTLAPKIVHLTSARVPKATDVIVQTQRKVHNASDWLTVITGGTALGLASLAVAPAALGVAAVAAAVGAVLGKAATRFDTNSSTSGPPRS